MKTFKRPLKEVYTRKEFYSDFRNLIYGGIVYYFLSAQFGFSPGSAFLIAALITIAQPLLRIRNYYYIQMTDHAFVLQNGVLSSLRKEFPWEGIRQVHLHPNTGLFSCYVKVFMKDQTHTGKISIDLVSESDYETILQLICARNIDAQFID